MLRIYSVGQVKMLIFAELNLYNENKSICWSNKVFSAKTKGADEQIWKIKQQVFPIHLNHSIIGFPYSYWLLKISRRKANMQIHHVNTFHFLSILPKNIYFRSSTHLLHSFIFVSFIHYIHSISNLAHILFIYNLHI